MIGGAAVRHIAEEREVACRVHAFLGGPGLFALTLCERVAALSAAAAAGRPAAHSDADIAAVATELCPGVVVSLDAPEDWVSSTDGFATIPAAGRFLSSLLRIKKVDRDIGVIVASSLAGVTYCVKSWAMRNRSAARALRGLVDWVRGMLNLCRHTVYKLPLLELNEFPARLASKLQAEFHRLSHVPLQLEASPWAPAWQLPLGTGIVVRSEFKAHDWPREAVVLRPGLGGKVTGWRPESLWIHFEGMEKPLVVHKSHLEKVTSEKDVAELRAIAQEISRCRILTQEEINFYDKRAGAEFSAHVCELQDCNERATFLWGMATPDWALSAPSAAAEPSGPMLLVMD